MDTLVLNLIADIGAAFDNLAQYGLQHRATESALSDSHRMLTQFLAERERFSLGANGDALIVNGNAVSSSEAICKTIADTFRKYSISTLSFDSGVSFDDYVLLFSVFTYSPEEVEEAGGLDEVLQDEGVRTISSQKLSLVLVSDEELVIDGDQVTQTMTPEEVESRDSKFIRFLCGGDALSGEDLASFKEASHDPVQLGELVIAAATEAATEMRKDHDPSPSEFVEMVVGCKHRAFDLLMHDISFTSQKGKRELSKAAMSLEEWLRQYLKNADIGITDEELKGITLAAEDIEDVIRIDALAAEYCKKRSASQSSEQKLIRYLKRRGRAGGSLKKKLIDGGMSPSAWVDLLVEAGVREEHGAVMAEDDPPLQHLEEMMRQLGHESQAIGSWNDPDAALRMEALLGQIQIQVAACTSLAKERVNTVLHELAKSALQEARNDGLSAEQLLNQPRPMPRKEMMIRLAKLSREIYEPMEVMDAILESIRVGGAGPVSVGQVQMLGLAAKSANRMRSLLDYVEKVSSDPRTFEIEEG